MICRYCGCAYTNDDRRCGGCGAPKTAVTKLLDVSAKPDHWSNSLRDTTLRVLAGTLAVGVICAVCVFIGWTAPAMVFAFFWAVPVAPSLLTYAAWRDAKGAIPQFMIYLTFAGMVWSGIFFITLLMVGVTMAG